MKTFLLALTPNPAIDRILTVPGFRTAEVCRITEVRESAGGKGINVARVTQLLGYHTRICGPLGGSNGQRIAAFAQQEGLDAIWTWLTTGESRTCDIIVDPGVPDTLVLNERGPKVSQEDWAVLATQVQHEATSATAFTVSGSLPIGVAPEWLVQLIAQILPTGLPTYIDTSGPALQAILRLPVTAIKINAEELGDVLGTTIVTTQEAYHAARRVQEYGPRVVIVTLGKVGAVAVGPTEAWFAQAPDVAAISPVGSGDAFLSGVVVGLSEGQSLIEGIRLGVACGAANTLQVGGGLLSLDDVAALKSQVTINSISAV
ncbi:MAG: 1-phosphofructokinase family hexose kinase [Chloroflexota bacterium]